MNIEIAPKEYERYLNWYDGMLYCQLLIIDGKDDWRMPTLAELIYIYESENDFDSAVYWSSAKGNNVVWCKKFSDGYQNLNFPRFSFHVRAVRTIEPS